MATNPDLSWKRRTPPEPAPRQYPVGFLNSHTTKSAISLTPAPATTHRNTAPSHLNSLMTST